MRIRWCSLILIALFPGAVFGFDRVKIEAGLDSSRGDIVGWVEVTYDSLEVPTDDIVFRMYANFRSVDPYWNAGGDQADSSWTVVDSVLVGGKNMYPQSTTLGTHFRVQADRPYAVGESLSVRLHFCTHVAPSPRLNDRVYRIGNEYILDGWFPMPAPRRGGEWVIVKYDDAAELVADFFDFDVTMTTPVSLQVIAAGQILSDTSSGLVTHRYILPIAHDFAVFIAPVVERRSYRHGDVVISVYSDRPDFRDADELARAAGVTMDSMASWVHPYPFKELHIIVCGIAFSGGIELPRMILQSPPRMVPFLRPTGGVVIHEVIHQWFYGIINSNQAVSPWMDEAVADYFTARVSRAYNGEGDLVNWYGFQANYADGQRLQGQPYFDQLPVTLATSGYAHGAGYFPIVYDKGAVVIRTLCRHMTPADEVDFWHRYYDRYSFRSPTEGDFVDLLSTYAPFRGTSAVEQILHTTDRVDYQVVRVANDELPAKLTPGDSTASDHTVSRTYRATVDYALYHPLNLPVTVRYFFRDGSVRDTTVQPEPGRHQIQLETSILLAGVWIDPDEKVGLDQNLLNNSCTIITNGAAARLFSGITFLIESLFSYVWGI